MATTQRMGEDRLKEKVTLEGESVWLAKGDVEFQSSTRA